MFGFATSGSFDCLESVGHWHDADSERGFGGASHKLTAPQFVDLIQLVFH
jgi:hypothetical protein